MTTSPTRLLNASAFAVIVAAGILAFSAPSSFSQQQVSRLVAPINERVMVTLNGNVRPDVAHAPDLGPVEDGKPMRLMLLLEPTAAQKADLENLLANQQNPDAAEYHKWLTPTEFGARFGASHEDIAKVTSWLQSHGFQVHGSANNARMIDFSANAGQVREAFHTQLHYVNVEGGKYSALLQDPQIPAALAPVVAGIHGLNQIPLRPSHTAARPASWNKETHKWQIANPATAKKALPAVDLSNGDLDVAPQDLYTIYNVNPVFAGGNLAETATVAVIEESDMEYGTVDPSTGAASGGDVAAFRSLFGVPGTLNMFVLNGFGADTCSDPGIDPSGTGEDFEASLDAEWANATAPSANLIFMSCSPADDGVGYSLFALIDNNLSDVMSMSYVSSELGFSSSNYAYLDSLYEEAAAQGQTIVIAAGDAGSDVEDQDTVGTATAGINVSALSASPLVTSAGGTDFQDAYDYFLGGAPQSYYWSSTNSPSNGSALGYVPEMAWNNSCASSILSEDAGLYFLGEPFTGAEFCDFAGAYGLYEFVEAAVVGGSGGISTNYAVPTWQTGLSGYSNAKRSQPDISGFAANGFWGHALVACDSNPNLDGGGGDCVNGVLEAGGTSFVAPYTAGVFGLLDTAAGARQGNLNPALYALAKTQFNSSATKTACYANGQATNVGITTNLPAPTCIFNDVTTGNNDVPCSALALDCYIDSGAPDGMLSLNGTKSLSVAYNSKPGFDQVTGLGSLNVANLITGMSGVSLTMQTLTFSPKGGIFTGPLTVGITDSVWGATIYYTTDGTAPTTGSAIFNSASPISVTQDTTIRALGVARGYMNMMSTADYKLQVAEPTFSLAAGTFDAPQSVTISDSSGGGCSGGGTCGLSVARPELVPAITIWYTTDGTPPVPGAGTAVPYSGTAIAINQTTTLKAVAALANWTTSKVASANYKLEVPTPTFSEKSGTYTSTQSVSISDTNAGATIWYTTDNSTPIVGISSWIASGGSISITQTTTLKVIAAITGWTNSYMATAMYTLKVPTPTINPVAGTYHAPQSVSLSDSFGGGGGGGCGGSGSCGEVISRPETEAPTITIWYTTDGTPPIPGTSTQYTGPITVSTTETIKAIAAFTGWSNSMMISAKYTIDLPPPPATK
jgi:Pro-kumamolisin, activation domain/Chitobiase/beta-hexosaminidase C-terminal domain/Fn3 associated